MCNFDPQRVNDVMFTIFLFTFVTFTYDNVFLLIEKITYTILLTSNKLEKNAWFCTDTNSVTKCLEFIKYHCYF